MDKRLAEREERTVKDGMVNLPFCVYRTDDGRGSPALTDVVSGEGPCRKRGGFTKGDWAVLARVVWWVICWGYEQHASSVCPVRTGLGSGFGDGPFGGRARGFCG